MLFYTSLPRPSLSGAEKIKTTPSIFPSAGGGTEHWKNVNTWGHDVREWAGVFLLNAFFGASHAFIMHRLLLSSQGGWEVGRSFGEASQAKGTGGEGERGEGRKKNTLQFPPPRRSAGAGWEHMRTADALGGNKSHMEKDWKLFNCRRAGRSVPATAVCSREENIPLLLFPYVNDQIKPLSGHGAEMQPCVIRKGGSRED